MDGYDTEVDQALAAITQLARNGLSREALTACERLLRKAPCCRAAWRLRAHLLARQHAWAAAIDSLAQASDPSAVPAVDLLCAGRWRLEASDFYGAFATFSALLGRGPEADVRAWRGTARLLRAVAATECGRHDEALRDCARLPRTARLRVRARTWRVHDIQREAAAALRERTSQPHAR